MGYRTLGLLHAELHHARTRIADGQDGQGTVEYVGLILLVSGLLVGIIAAGKGMADGGIAKTVAGKLKETINGVGER